MTRVATPESQELLLIYAQSSTGAQLERICRGLRQVTRPKGQADEDERWVRRRHLPSGMVRIEAQLLPDEAEIVMTALAEARRAARSPNDSHTRCALRRQRSARSHHRAAHQPLALGWDTARPGDPR